MLLHSLTVAKFFIIVFTPYKYLVDSNKCWWYITQTSIHFALKNPGSRMDSDMDETALGVCWWLDILVCFQQVEVDGMRGLNQVC